MTMGTPYIFLDYVPVNNRQKPASAVLCWLERDAPKVFATGLRPDGRFDPVLFAGAFPSDASEAWVFAEWIGAIRARIARGLYPGGVAAFVELDPLAALRPGEEGEADSPDALLSRLSRGTIRRTEVAGQALAYLIEEASGGKLTVSRRSDGMLADYCLISKDGELPMQLKIKKWAPRSIVPAGSEPAKHPWHVVAYEGAHGSFVTALTAPNNLDQVVSWLGQLPA